MRITRVIAVTLAWVPTIVALALIWKHVNLTYPDWRDTLQKTLYGRPEPEPDIRYLSRFSDEGDLEKWYRMGGARLIMRGKWGKLTFRESKGTPGIRFTDYIAGPARARDWSPYCWLKWDMRAPGETEQKLELIIKDVGEKRFSMAFPMPRGEPEHVSVSLTDLKLWIDPTRIAEVHFFMSSPAQETTVDMKDLRLEKGGCAPGEVLGKPFVVFEKLEAPESARLGEMVMISAWLSVTQPQTLSYHAFLHLFPESEKHVKVPAHRKGYIHIERLPLAPVPDWPVGTPQEVGPFTVYIPTGNPTGKYLIRIGLFNSISQGDGPRDVPYTGAFDYGGSFPKPRYTDQSLDDFTVGSILVKEQEAQGAQ
jgi:hypothetical protein